MRDLRRIDPWLRIESMFLARTYSKRGTRSDLLGRMYDIAVKATKQVSPMISGEFLRKRESW